MASAQAIVDHDRIREWAEARGAQPACVKGTGGKGDTGMIRLDLPGFSGADSLQAIPWKQWFRQFDANNLALLVQEKTSRGQKSNFNKLISRDGETGRSAPKRAKATQTRANRSARSGSREGAAKTGKRKLTTRTNGRGASGTAGRSAAKTAAAAQPLTGHREIRAWAEARGARPACVKGTGGRNDPGMIRLDFPGFTGAKSLQEISWREWFSQFDANNLALLVQEQTRQGQKSNFNKLVRREPAADGRRGARESSRPAGGKKAAGTRAASSASQRRSSKSAALKSGARKPTRSQSTRTRSAAPQGRKRVRRAP
jgi:hypothetical protein